MSAAGVTAVIPVWNRKELLERALASLRAQTRPPEEILVVDNGSTDGSAEVAERLGARVLRMGSNTGFANAVNCGIRAARTAWIAVLNNDVVLDPEYLERLAAAAGEAGAWFATGKLLDPAQPGKLDGVFDSVCRGGCAWRVGNGRADGPEFSVPRPIPIAPATAALFRAELFARAGFFAETFCSYLEDVDFGLRCAAMKYPGLLVPSALAYHAGSATLGRWHPVVVRLIARNQVLLVARHYPARLLLRFAWPILVAQAGWGLVALRHGAGAAFLAGKWAGLRLFRAARRSSPELRKNAAIEQVLRSGEADILDCQRRTGFDAYWRMYFLLARGGAK